jgi:hypothetical protein
MSRYFTLLPLLIALLCSGGCNTAYVPVSWGQGEQVRRISTSDPTLTALFNHYDPDHKTIRFTGSSFEEVMMPSEVKYHLGAYRPDTKLIYRNLYREYTEQELRDLMVHEFAHHIWFTFMTTQERNAWRKHLILNPSPVQEMVRGTYGDPATWEAEDFAFTVQYPRIADIEMLGTLKVITPEEKEVMLKQLASRARTLQANAQATTDGKAAQ